MVMDFKAIEDFWFGDLPEFPFEPLGLGIEFPQPVEFVNPFETYGEH